MELKELYGLMDRFAASGLTALEWEKDGERVALRREQTVVSAAGPVLSAPPAPAPQEAWEEGEAVTAPLVGVFYAAPAPEEPPYVTPGAHVKKGDTLCLIEAMKMMSEVPAPADCVVEEVLVQDGEAVGVGAPLFRIRRT
ncbi:acetyl-CoA carboxylase biotin carboxyl carrier protein [Flintibacter muris]|uniref:acetyl-CoA carboxylase biotin carboxyl carrier protein n=1 Tax=Flintibacter muris TaxID=2941327 RepID=UPI0020413182|nr:biotin/lipoyl-containing protein [Flintibacter muris]